MDRAQLDPVLVVADREERVARRRQRDGVVGDRLAGGLLFGVVERLDLGLLRSAKGPLILLDMAVQPECATQTPHELPCVRDGAQVIEQTSGFVTSPTLISLQTLDCPAPRRATPNA